MRVVDVICLVAAIGGAAYVYNVKHEAEVAHEESRALERDIDALSRDVGLLEADLAALQEPARLQAVVSSRPDVFDLEPIQSAHYIRLADIPFRSELETATALEEGAVVDGEGSDPQTVIDAPGEIDLLLRVLNVVPAGDVPAVEQVEPEDGIGALLQGVAGQAAQ